MTKKYYVQRRSLSTGELETVDEYEFTPEGRREAYDMVREYNISDPDGSHYMSTRPCKNWSK